MLERAKYAAETTAQRFALGLAGTAVLCVGAAFLTVAAWMAIEMASAAITANVIVGAAYFGGGLILLVWSRSPRRRRYYRHPRTVAPPPANAGSLVTAFMQGVGAGMATRR
jgi:hypothetical protein